jgi:hypothetical protein
MKNPHKVQQWFDTSAFSTPAPGTWGNETHNEVRGPGRHNWNISLSKSFVFDEARGTASNSAPSSSTSGTILNG